ncbi:YadA-like family protein [Lichenihabitans sp. Uapishka_5]|uniref:YadA-like family protein n=1 Tax=Lichenihabitans sp. Uapishka_5 TaxID=3037302 RepID=UPI0029E804B1|nr:YadA-like family protein [Lichenihabitans sp. Uapishka_5]MDX7950023.1 YadA-like family protein [Lichenihabitans sp. Uapishka_5]
MGQHAKFHGGISSRWACRAGLLLGTTACIGFGSPMAALAAPASFTDVCTGLGVALPSLTGVVHSADTTLGTLLPPLNTVIDGVNTNVVAPLSGRQVGIGLLDPSTNTFVTTPSSACNLALNGLAVNNVAGITIGGGQITGLGTSGTPASAGALSAVALGNGATTAPGVANALALGTGATATAANSTALGAGSVAARGAVTAYDALGLLGTQNSAGEVSVGATGALRQVTNLAAGAADTDAANVGQVRGVSAQLGAATAATLGGGSVYNPLLGTVTLPSFTIRGTVYANVGAALDAVDVALGSTTPTTGGTAPFVGNNTAARAAPTATGADATAGGYGATATGRNSVALGAGSTDGGQADVVSVGAAGAERRIINVAAGQVAAGSTDAVNGGQLFNTTQQVASLQHGAVQYDRATDGTTLSSVTLGSDAGGPVVIHNLAPGVATNDAATVGQVQAVAATSVQYTTVDGVKTNTITLSGGQPGGVTIGNLAPGQQGTDAVNLNQLQSASAGTLGQAQAYTDSRISNLQALTGREIASARRDAAGGTALALAATGLRYDDRPGKFSVGGATAYYNGQVGLAFGVAGTSETGRVRVNAAISAAPTIDHPDVGGVIGASFAIN